LGRWHPLREALPAAAVMAVVAVAVAVAPQARRSARPSVVVVVA
jgi:anti-sigma-K factor RskA